MRGQTEIPPWVEIGKGDEIDKNVLLGYNPERKIARLKTIIGKKARIRSGSVIYAGCRIGDNLETGHNTVVREENIIGDNFKIWSNSILDYGCKIGKNVKIHSNCYIAQSTIIEDDVFIAPGVITANAIYPVSKFFKEHMKGPTIKKEAKIGINSTILPFVEIGEHSLIGAGSVVTKDIPPKSVAYGNPAKIIGSVDNLRDIKLWAKLEGK